MANHSLFAAELHRYNLTLNSFSENGVVMVSYNARVRIEAALVSNKWLMTVYVDTTIRDTFTATYLSQGFVSAVKKLDKHVLGL